MYWCLVYRRSSINCISVMSLECYYQALLTEISIIDKDNKKLFLASQEFTNSLEE